jgi:hypothetical protein
MLKILFAIVGSIGLVAFLIGAVALIRPYGNISTRKRGLGVMAGGVIVVVFAGVFGPPADPTPSAVATPKSGEGQIEPARRETAAIDACYEAATTEAATAHCDAQWRTWSDRMERQADAAGARADREIAEINRRSDCIRRELGERYDNANSVEISAARRRCGINDPENMEQLLREQRERLSR